MEISALTLKLIILIIPGVIATTIYKRLTVRHKEGTDFMFIISSIIFGMFSYLILQIAILFCNAIYNAVACIPREYNVLNTFKSLPDGDLIPYDEVIWASVISIPLIFVVTYFDNKKTVNTIAKHLRVSNKYGDENLFTYYLNSPSISWVYVRDLVNNLTYSGWIKAFSENTQFKEIILEDVTVFNYPDSEELYEIERIYLCMPIDKIIIEQAKLKPTTNGEEQTVSKS